jgi:DNA-binding LacI/PurR family transcriptional regulator
MAILNRRATIKDVARLAEVDISTVSRVINNKATVAAETRERVLAVIEALDYKPNSAARAMVTQKTRAIALLVPDLADANVAVIAAGIEAGARQAGYSLVVACYDLPDDAGDAEPKAFFAEHRVDGLILMSPRHFREGITELPLATLEETPVDNRQGGRLVGEHLLRLGHRQVAFLGGPESSPHSHERAKGLREKCAAAQMIFGDWTASCGYELASRLFESGDPVTAIFAASDAVALGVLNAAHRYGYAVPKELSVVGFDNQTASRYYWPPLTTVDQPLRQLGMAAFERLLSRIEGREARSVALQPVTLIIRDSTGPAR